MQDFRPRGEPYRTMRLCVDSYENGVLAGRFYHPGLPGGGQSFMSLSQFLVAAENLFDEAKFPQSFEAKRGFVARPDVRPGAMPELNCEQGKAATFVIRLMFRQHASWQGSVTWVEARSEEPFRSVLELILMIDGALKSGSGGE